MFASAIFLFLCGLGIRNILAANGGELVYPLDDTYIHLALAKTFHLHGTLGVTPHYYGPAASSIGWPFLILGGMKVAGMNPWIPMVLSVTAAVGGMFAAAWLLAMAGMNKWLSAIFLYIMIAITPLPSVALLGMEHAYHVSTVLFVLAAAYRALELEGDRGWKLLAVAGMLAVSARYESLVLLAALGGCFLVARRWKLALAMVLSGTPALLYSVYLKSTGGEWLPNSVLIKKAKPSLYPKVYAWLWNSPEITTMLLLIVLFLVAFALRAYWTKRMPAAGYLAFAALVASLVHAAFAPGEQMYRYEAYLHAMTFVCLLVAAMEPMFKPAARRGFLFVLAFFAVRDFHHRMDEGLRLMPMGAREIRLHPGTIADFMNRYYPAQGVAVNDIGYVSWASDAKVIDSYGLANMDVMRMRAGGRFDEQALAEYCKRKGAPIAIVYTRWVPGFTGSRDLKWVGELRIHSRTVVAYPRLTFLAVGEENVTKLRASLRDYATRLPPELRYVEVLEQN